MFQYKYTAEGSVIKGGVKYYYFELHEKIRNSDWSVCDSLLVSSLTGEIVDDLY